MTTTENLPERVYLRSGTLLLGGRIRATNGQGYSDAVSDAQILQHLREPDTDALDNAFKIAALGIRNYERLALQRQATQP